MIKSFEDLKPNSIKEPTASRVPWANDVLNRNTRSDTPSPLLIWFETEDKKRRQGLQNEIDINEIKAAFKGVKNKWSKAVEKNPDLFKPLTDSGDGKVNWQEILDAKQSA